MAPHQPADNAAREEINEHGETGETFLRADVGDVGYPSSLGCCHIELHVHSVVDDDGRLPTTLPRLTLLVDLRFDVGQFRRAGNAIQADAFTLLEKFVIPHTVTVDLDASHLRLH